MLTLPVTSNGSSDDATLRCDSKGQSGGGGREAEGLHGVTLRDYCILLPLWLFGRIKNIDGKTGNRIR